MNTALNWKLEGQMVWCFADQADSVSVGDFMYPQVGEGPFVCI